MIKNKSINNNGFIKSTYAIEKHDNNSAASKEMPLFKNIGTNTTLQSNKEDGSVSYSEPTSPITRTSNKDLKHIIGE